MAIALDAVATTTGDAASFTFALTVAGADRFLRVGVHWRTTSITVSGITYAGVALTRLGGATVSVNRAVDYWYLIAPTTGTNNVVVTMSAAARTVVGAISRTGVHQTTPLGTAATASGTSTAPSVTVTSATDELVDDALTASVAGAVLTAGTGQTERYDTFYDPSIQGGGSDEAGAASVAMDWTINTSQEWCQIGVGIKPAGAAGTSLTPPVGSAVLAGIASRMDFGVFVPTEV